MKLIKPAAMKLKDAAAYLGIGISDLRERTDTGEIPCRKLGKCRYFIVSELDQWLKDTERWVETDGNTAKRTGPMACGLSPASELSH